MKTAKTLSKKRKHNHCQKTDKGHRHRVVLCHRSVELSLRPQIRDLIGTLSIQCGVDFLFQKERECYR